jgi:hypothetical protein
VKSVRGSGRGVEAQALRSTATGTSEVIATRDIADEALDEALPN